MITEDIIKQAQAGSGEAFAIIYNETVKTAYYVAKRILLDDDATEDVLQEAYISVFKNLSNFQTGNLQGWIDTIVANRAKNYLRRKSPILFSEMETEDNPVVEFEEEKVEFRPDEKVDYNETQRLVLEIVDNLSPEQRLSVMLFYFEERSVKEIAEICECSENTVKSRLNYARKKIKEDVLELEKKGTKLYSVSIIPFIVWMLSEKAKASMISPSSATKIFYGVNAGLSAPANVAGSAVVNQPGNMAYNMVGNTTANMGTVAGTTAGITAGTVASTTAGMVASKAGLALGVKIAIAAVAGAVVIGGTAAGVGIAYYVSNQESGYGSYVEGPRAEEDIYVKVGNVRIPITSSLDDLIDICERNNWEIEESLYPDESGWSSKPYNRKGSIITPDGELLVSTMANEENNGSVIEYIAISPFYYEGDASILGVTPSTSSAAIEAKFDYVKEEGNHTYYYVDEYVVLKVDQDDYKGKYTVSINRTPYNKR